MPFSFEALDVYQKSIDLAVSMLRLVEKMSDDYPGFREELVDAATSVGVKIAQGGGTWGKSAKKDYFASARSSCYRCVAFLAIASDLGLAKEQDKALFYEQIEVLAKMLSKLIQSIDKERNKPTVASTAA